MNNGHKAIVAMIAVVAVLLASMVAPEILVAPMCVLMMAGILVWHYHRYGPKPGCCLNCAYDLRGSPDDRCPECG